MPTEGLRQRAVDYFQDLQDRIVAALEALDGSPFREDAWQARGRRRRPVCAC